MKIFIYLIAVWMVVFETQTVVTRAQETPPPIGVTPVPTISETVSPTGVVLTVVDPTAAPTTTSGQTPTSTIEITPSVMASVSATITPMAAITETLRPTPSEEASVSGTVAPTPSEILPTPTAEGVSLTPTVTPEVELTATPIPSGEISPTPTPEASVTPTNSPTPLPPVLTPTPPPKVIEVVSGTVNRTVGVVEKKVNKIQETVKQTIKKQLGIAEIGDRNTFLEAYEEEEMMDSEEITKWLTGSSSLTLAGAWLAELPIKKWVEKGMKTLGLLSLLMLISSLTSGWIT